MTSDHQFDIFQVATSLIQSSLFLQGDYIVKNISGAKLWVAGDDHVIKKKTKQICLE